MPEKPISAENRVDLAERSPDLWSAAALQTWRETVLRALERDDGLHWIVDGERKGMWNGAGSSFPEYRMGSLTRIADIKRAGFACEDPRGARPRTTTLETRIADRDEDSVAGRFSLIWCIRRDGVLPLETSCGFDGEGALAQP